MTELVVNLTQLREALRVAEQTDRDLADADPVDSVQIHLEEPEESVLRIVLFSNGAGQAVGAYTIDTGEAPGESGVAVQTPPASPEEARVNSMSDRQAHRPCLHEGRVLPLGRQPVGNGPGSAPPGP